jgi:hypothetical protein
MRKLQAKVDELNAQGYDAHIHVASGCHGPMVAVIVNCVLDAQDRPPRTESREEYDKRMLREEMSVRHNAEYDAAFRTQEREASRVTEAEWVAKQEEMHRRHSEEYHTLIGGF